MKKSSYIKILIKEKNLKVKDIAKKMNIAAASLSAKINGHRLFKEHEIDILLKELNMSYEDVFRTSVIKIKENNVNTINVNGKDIIISDITLDKIMDIINDDKKKEVI